MQTSVAVNNGAITGTLKYLNSGALATDWGPGNFMALGFASSDTGIEKILVGMDPSVSSGLVPLDSDMDGVFKVTDKDAQEFVVVSCGGMYRQVDRYDLSGLTLQAQASG